MTKGNYMTPTTNEIIIKSFEVLIAFICVVFNSIGCNAMPITQKTMKITRASYGQESL